MAHIPPEMHLIEEKDLIINCIVLMGTPKPKIQWFKNGILIKESSKVLIIFTIINSIYLILDSKG